MSNDPGRTKQIVAQPKQYCIVKLIGTVMKWNMIRAKNTSITWYKHSISTILQHPRAQSDGGSRRRTGHHSAAQPKLWSHTGMLSVLRAVLGLRSLIQKKRY